MVRTAVLRAFGSEMRSLLAGASRSRLGVFGVGLGVTALLQSSAATALLLTGFAGRGMIGVAPALAAMLGADIGSTLIVQVLSFDIAVIAPGLILFGVLIFMPSGATRWRQSGRILLGLGLMLLALELIGAATAPLAGSDTLAAVIAPLAADPVFAVVLGALVAWGAHSSVAIVLVIMSMAASGAIAPPLAFALVLGANVGSGLIPIPLTLGERAPARRIPIGNLLVRTLGAVAVLPLVQLAAPHLAALGGEPARLVANFHTGFNLVLAAVALPLVGGVARLTAYAVRGRRHGDETDPGRPRYLDDSAVDTPAVAIACATREVMRLADLVEGMLRDSLRVVREDDAKLMSDIVARDDSVDRLFDAIKLYITRITHEGTPDSGESERCTELLTFAINLEHIGDIVETNLMDLAYKKMHHGLHFSDAGWAEVQRIHQRVVANMGLAINVFVSRDVASARQLVNEKAHLRELERAASDAHVNRLREGKPESVESSGLHLDVLRDLKRINSHITATAYPLLEAAGELRETRLRERSGAPRAAS
ncbi:phosphate:Na+ symporter [Limimonas halophila]|uniref:Phosphate:Na+ symporter n=2 Tax=Limimonas halophila TaxID=1082479 RepID=A0A1G7M216_9PROT|nr:phosphate:Na+ symporter [Limimonas halophila]